MKSVLRKYSQIPFLIIFIVILAKNPFTACTKGNSQFFDKVLSDFDTTSYFIALDIKAPTYKGRAIIENKDLYLFLNRTKGLDKEKYKTYMTGILSHRRSLKINNKDLLNVKFKKVYNVESIIRNSNNGRDSFISYYFNGKILNYVLIEREQNAVINQLFYWEIPAKIDKLTGYLIIG